MQKLLFLTSAANWVRLYYKTLSQTPIHAICTKSFWCTRDLHFNSLKIHDSCVCVLRYSSAHQTHSFDYVLTFLIGPFQLSDGAQLRFHCSFCLTGSVAFDHPNQSHTFIYSVMVMMTNVFVVWGIQLITLIVFDGFIKVADFLSRMRNFFWLM